MEWRSVGGGFLEPGPATVWMRMRQPLVAGEEPTPLQRALVAADVGNGISAVLDWRRYLFINVDLTVHLERMPEGEWVCVDAVTCPQPNGIGTAESVLSDQRGRIGRAVQTLLIAAALSRRRPVRRSGRLAAAGAAAAGRSPGDQRRRGEGDRRGEEEGALVARSAPRRRPASGAPKPTPASKKAVKVPSAAPRRVSGTRSTTISESEG